MVDLFGEFWTILLSTRVPRPVHKAEAQRAFNARIKSPELYARLLGALSKYWKSKRVLAGFVQDASTWIRDWEQWENDVEVGVPVQIPPPTQEEYEAAKEASRVTVAREAARAEADKRAKWESVRPRAEKWIAEHGGFPRDIGAWTKADQNFFDAVGIAPRLYVRLRDEMKSRGEQQEKSA